MSIASASEFFKEIQRHPERFYIIHYSCQSLYDDNDGLSPRVTSIAVLHYGTGQTVSFSTHTIAEELGFERSAVAEHFDEIESKLLSQFFNFIRDRRDKFWVHWNMRNLTYGFEHIEHRYRKLTKNDAVSVPVERRLNLNDMLAERFGSDYATHPKLTNLMEQNGGRHRHFLTGPEEVEAFKKCEFIRMHQSTLCKVGFFRSAIVKTLEGRLITQSKLFFYKIDRLFDSRAARAIGFFSSAIGIISSLVGIPVWLL